VNFPVPPDEKSIGEMKIFRMKLKIHHYKEMGNK